MTKEDYEKWIKKLVISHTGKKLTEEQRKIRSIRFSGENNPRYGKPGTNLGKKIF